MMPSTTKPTKRKPSASSITKVPNAPAFDSRASYRMMNSM